MKRWYLGGRPDLLAESEGDDLTHDCEIADTPDASMEFLMSLRE